MKVSSLHQRWTEETQASVVRIKVDTEEGTMVIEITTDEEGVPVIDVVTGLEWNDLPLKYYLDNVPMNPQVVQ
jgi:ribosome maturation factor RimP